MYDKSHTKQAQYNQDKFSTAALDLILDSKSVLDNMVTMFWGVVIF